MSVTVSETLLVVETGDPREANNSAARTNQEFFFFFFFSSLQFPHLFARVRRRWLLLPSPISLSYSFLDAIYI